MGNHHGGHRHHLGMGVGHNIELCTATRGYRRNLVWAREIVWGAEFSLEDGGAAAVERLAVMGLGPMGDGWWRDLDPETPIPHLYAVLERNPGSTGT